MAALDESAVDRIRRMTAELELLTTYDVLRECAGHDYGAGQRANELRRRRRELDRARADAAVMLGGRVGDYTDDPTGRELLAAWQRVGEPRLRLARLQPRGDGTPATIRTWERVERSTSSRFERELRHIATFCSCETPVMDAERDAGCRRCGRPVDFTPEAPCLVGESIAADVREALR